MYIFNSCTTKKLATNELPLTEEDEETQASSSSKFMHPFSISEDEESSGDTTPTEVTKTEIDFKEPSAATEENAKKY